MLKEVFLVLQMIHEVPLELNMYVQYVIFPGSQVGSLDRSSLVRHIEIEPTVNI